MVQPVDGAVNRWCCESAIRGMPPQRTADFRILRCKSRLGARTIDSGPEEILMALATLTRGHCQKTRW
jgi:hypothetical protein